MNLGIITDVTQDEPHFISQLDLFLQKNKDKYSADLIGDLSYIHFLAECHAGINIQSIVAQGQGKYKLDYTYDWSVFNGCMGMNESDSVQGSTWVWVDKKGMVSIQVPDVEERNTIDEY